MDLLHSSSSQDHVPEDFSSPLALYCRMDDAQDLSFTSLVVNRCCFGSLYIQFDAFKIRRIFNSHCLHLKHMSSIESRKS